MSTTSTKSPSKKPPSKKSPVTAGPTAPAGPPKPTGPAEPFPLTAEPIPEAGPLSSAQSMTLCAGCVRCCTYVAVEVDAPDAPWMYDQYVWLLYHANIWMYVESGNRWFVQFETRCDKLSAQGHCTVHGRHPVLCKDYDPRSCERRVPGSDLRARFHDGDDLVAWLARHRPTHYRRYRAWFEKQHEPKKYGNAPAQVRDSGAARRGNLAATFGTVRSARFAMPPPPVNPLLFRTPAARVAYRKATGPDGNGVRPGKKRVRPIAKRTAPAPASRR